MKNLYCGNNLYFCARNNSKGMKEKLKGHSAMFTANFLWGIMSPISKAIFLTGTISAFSLTNMRMAGAAILFWIASLFMPREPITKRDLLLLFRSIFVRDNIESGFLCVGIVLYDADRCFGRRFFGSYYYHDIGCIYPERAYDRQEGCGCIYGAFGSFNAYFERSGHCFGRAFGWPGYGRLVLFGR